MKNPYGAYSRANFTVPKTKQVVMLYDAMIRNLSQAREAMMEGNVEVRYHKLVRASEIIVGLQMSLDFEQGQDAARSLYDFYSLFESRLMTLHRSGDVILCDQLIEELRGMREMWHQFDAGSAAPHAQRETFDAEAESAEAIEILPPSHEGQTSSFSGRTEYMTAGVLTFSA